MTSMSPESRFDSLFDKFKTSDLVWSNQIFTNMANSLYKQMCGFLPESSYDVKTQQVLDDFSLKALQWFSTDDQPNNLVSLDISKCYPSILINNRSIYYTRYHRALHAETSTELLWGILY